MKILFFLKLNRVYDMSSKNIEARLHVNLKWTQRTMYDVSYIIHNIHTVILDFQSGLVSCWTYNMLVADTKSSSHGHPWSLLRFCFRLLDPNSNSNWKITKMILQNSVFDVLYIKTFRFSCRIHLYKKFILKMQR